MMLPAGDLVLSSEDERNYRPKHVELIEMTNKLLLLHLVGCLYHYKTCGIYDREATATCLGRYLLIYLLLTYSMVQSPS